MTGRRYQNVEIAYSSGNTLKTQVSLFIGKCSKTYLYLNDTIAPSGVVLIQFVQ